MPLNYITRKEQSKIDSLLDKILLDTDMSYPEQGVIDIIKAYIPDVSVIEFDFEGNKKIRGAIFKKSPKFQKNLIVIRESLTKEGKTFSLAHEFGHYCLGHTGSANFMIDDMTYDGSERMQKEAEAQYFAASLLMPREKFISLMNIMDESGLAQRFGVSIAAARVRKAWLDGSGREKTL